MQPHSGDNPVHVGHPSNGAAAPLNTPPVPLRIDAEGQPVFEQWDDPLPDPPPEPQPEILDAEIVEDPGEPRRAEEPPGPPAAPGTELATIEDTKSKRKPRSREVARLDKMSDAELLAEAGIEPIVSTTEAAEYFDRSNQWMYWGLRPDPKTGEHIFVWSDGTPIVPERIGDPESGRRRFTMPILRAIMMASHHRGNLEPEELTKVLRRIRYTELGVEWREREGWKYVDLGRNRHRWVRPENAYYDSVARVWRLATTARLETDADTEALPVTEHDLPLDVEEVSPDTDQ